MTSPPTVGAAAADVTRNHFGMIVKYSHAAYTPPGTYQTLWFIFLRCDMTVHYICGFSTCMSGSVRATATVLLCLQVPDCIRANAKDHALQIFHPHPTLKPVQLAEVSYRTIFADRLSPRIAHLIRRCGAHLSRQPVGPTSSQGNILSPETNSTPAPCASLILVLKLHLERHLELPSATHPDRQHGRCWPSQHPL